MFTGVSDQGQTFDQKIQFIAVSGGHNIWQHDILGAQIKQNY